MQDNQGDMLPLGGEHSEPGSISNEPSEESEYSGSDFETDEEIPDFVDPRKKIDWWDIPHIECIREYARFREWLQFFCTRGRSPSTEGPNVLKTCVKLLFCILFYTPFLYFFTHYYPATKVGCSVGEWQMDELDYVPIPVTNLAPPEALCAWECECDLDE